MPRLRLPRASLRLSLLLLLIAAVNAQSQGNFEDADKANEYTDQQFDLRHTIPGEPGVDYPILSEVPKTSFVCKGRHEGYYADVESRCQAFRICAHTARSAQGFGFLCPNGTVFSQQKFVCDWYRNVDCDVSERYYDMNLEHSVGSTQEMMERVRQMMEYPTVTISKALQQTQTPSQQQPKQKQHQRQHIHHQTLSKDLSSSSGVLSQPAAVINPSHKPLRGEDIKSEALPATTGTGTDDDIYVNSLGELSSDPGIQFDHTNAHIIAEYPREYHFQKQKNFAERVNAGLEQLEENAEDEHMAPDYIKQIRNTKDEATQLDLVSNINNLLEEVSTDLDPSVSGYQSMSPQQKVKQPFRFLSRGFAMHSNKNEKVVRKTSSSSSSSSSSYVYNRPKQTPGTVRFTPNEIPIDAHKDTEHKLKFNNNDKTTSSTTISTGTTDSTAATTTSTEAAFEALLIAPTLPPAYEDEDATTSHTKTAISTTSEPPIVGINYSSEVPIIESIGQAAALSANLDLHHNAPLDAAAAEKTDVHLQAEKLLLAGVKLTSHDEEIALRTNRLTLGSSSTTTSTTTTARPSTTAAMSTSTETVTEISSTQERIRSYRRFAQKRVGGSTRRQLQVPRSTTTARTTITTPATGKGSNTQRSTTPTRSYLERLAASRLRLSRLSLATKPTTTAKTTATTSAATSTITTNSPTTSTTATLLSQVRAGAELGPNKKLSVRDINRETGPQRVSWDSVQSNLQRFQVQRGNRVYTPATRAASSSTSSSVDNANITTRPTVSSTVQRGRNRHVTYRTQAPQQRTRGTTTPRSTSTSSTTIATTQRTTAAALSTLSQQISAIASGYSYTPAPHNPTTYTLTPTLAQTTQQQLQQLQQQQPQQPQQQQTLQTTSSLNPSSAFLPFDKLTRAIVDESILQNFKSSHAQRTPATINSNSNSQQQLQHPQQQQQQHRVAKPAIANSYNYPKPAAAAAPALSTLSIPPRPQQQQQQQPQLVLPTLPSIVIARAEGQRITPNSANNIISSLVNQPQPKGTSSNSYVTLNDFLNSKFGQAAGSNNGENVNIASGSTIQQQQQQQQQQGQQHQQHRQNHQQQHYQQQHHQQPLHQQQEHHQQQQHQQQHQRQPHKQQQQLSYITQRYQQQPQEQQQRQQQQQQRQQQHYAHQQQHFQSQHQQQEQQQHHQHQPQQQPINYQAQYPQQAYQQSQQLQQQQQQQQSHRPSIQSIQQPYLTPNIFVPYQQQQQHLPLFPPLASAAASAPVLAKTSHVAVRGQQADHLNVQLPALPNGLIPAPTTLQLAQKRSDVKVNQLQLTNSNRKGSSSGMDQGQEVSFYAGRTSYQVPQSSVGRLPNDITHLMRHRQRRY